MSELAQTDLTILRLLQTNARERLETIALETGLSVATVQRRIKSLKADGAITGEEAVISPKAVGFTMTFLVMVELERERIDQIDAFRRKARAEPQVQQCYYITGEADFALIAAHPADYVGNLDYTLTAHKFNPIMAMAGEVVIAEPHHIVPVGMIPPDAVKTPGVIVDHILERPHD